MLVWSLVLGEAAAVMGLETVPLGRGELIAVIGLVDGKLKVFWLRARGLLSSS